MLATCCEVGAVKVFSLVWTISIAFRAWMRRAGVSCVFRCTAVWLYGLIGLVLAGWWEGRKEVSGVFLFLRL